MKDKSSNLIYSLVDEEFINNFSEQHLNFMKEYYYSVYKKYCRKHNLEPLDKTNYLKKMGRSDKLIQACCPYCGIIRITIKKCSVKDIKHHKYCTNCGKGSASENAFFQLSRMLRIIHFNSAGLEMLENKKMKDLELLTYDIFQLELVQIVSVLEVILRDYFNAFMFLKYFNIKDDYLSKIVNKNLGNDFLNIEKANNHYKKALGINLREIVNDSHWLDLLDLVNMRNTIVHNNGMIDVKFKKTRSYSRLKNKIKGNLLFLDSKDINYYLKVVMVIIETISNLFEEKYNIERYKIIANFYFNVENNHI